MQLENILFKFHKSLFLFLGDPHLFNKHKYLDTYKVVLYTLFLSPTPHVWFPIQKLSSLFHSPFHLSISQYPRTTEVRKNYLCLSVLPQIFQQTRSAQGASHNSVWFISINTTLKSSTYSLSIVCSVLLNSYVWTYPKTSYLPFLLLLSSYFHLFLFFHLWAKDTI